MRFRFTLFLLLLNGALAIAIILLEKEQSSARRFAGEDRLLIGASRVEAFNRITLKGDILDEDWVLEHDSNRWFVRSPVEWRANPFAVERLRNQLRTLEWETRFQSIDLSASGRSLADYGLEQPRARLLLESAEAPPLELELGRVTEVGQRLYARIAGEDPVYVLDRQLLDGLVLEPDSLLDPQVMSLPSTQVRALQIQESGPRNLRLRLVREAGSWHFNSPIEARANDNAVLDLLTRLDRLRADDFLLPDEIPASPESISLRLRLESFQTRESIEILPAGETPEEGVFIRSEAFPTILKVNQPLLTILGGLEIGLRDRNLLAPGPRTWNSLEIRIDQRTTSLQRLENNQWQVVALNRDGEIGTFAAESARVEELQTLLRELTAETFVSDAPSEEDLQRFGLLQPQRTIRVEFAGEPAWELEVGDLAPETTQLYAKTNESTSVSLIRPFVLSQFPLSPLAYRDLTLRTFPESTEILEIRFLDRETGEDLLSSGGEAAETLRKGLTNLVRKTRVARYHDSSFEDPLVLDPEKSIPWKYRIEASYILPGADRESPSSIGFLLTERLGGTTQFIGFPDIGMTAFLEQDLIEQIEALVGERDRPALPAE